MEHVIDDIGSRRLMDEVKNILSADVSFIVLKKIAHVFYEIHIGIVPSVTVGDEEIFPAIVVKVGKLQSVLETPAI